MPMDRSLYPADWDDIARAVKERACWKCEECGVEHQTLIVRSDEDAARFISYDPDRDWYRDMDGELIGDLTCEFAGKFTRVILTVHHKGVDYPDGSPGSPHDKMDNRLENLAALCQRCHLLADLNSHQQKSRATRIRKQHERRLEAGQGELF
jgi:hypothetical protein